MVMGLWIKNLKFYKREAIIPMLFQLANSMTKACLDSKMSSMSSPHLFLRDIKVQPIDSIVKSVISLAKARSLHGFLAKMVEMFLSLLEDPSPWVRAKAVKSLTKMASLDPKILSLESVKQAVDSILFDKSIAVREEGVKLVSNYIILGDQLLSDNYLMALKPLLSDEGISVRKSVINILKDVLLKFPCHKYYKEICWALLERVSYPKEEESIKEMLCQIFQTTWFLQPAATTVASSALVEIFSAVDSSTAKNDSLVSAPKVRFLMQTLQESGRLSKIRIDYSALHVKFTAMQLIDMVELEEARPWMLTLLQELLHGKAAGNEASANLKQRRSDSFKHCENILDFMVELLLKAEEQNPALLSYLSDSGIDVHLYRVRIIAAVALFCSTHPPFVSRHLPMFLPYLKESNDMSLQLHTEVCCHVIKMLGATAVLEKHSLYNKSNEIILDLVNIALKQNGENVNLAIECIAQFVHNVTSDAMKFFKLAELCFNPLIDIASRLSQGNVEFSTVMSGRFQRGLVILGCICEHSRKCHDELRRLSSSFLGRSLTDKEAQRLEVAAANCLLKNASPLTPSNIYGSCYATIVYALTDLSVESIHVRAVRALCGVFAGYPRLMSHANDDGIIDRIFSSAYSEQVHERFLNGLKEMMVAEEVRPDQTRPDKGQDRSFSTDSFV